MCIVTLNPAAGSFFAHSVKFHSAEAKELPCFVLGFPVLFSPVSPPLSLLISQTQNCLPETALSDSFFSRGDVNLFSPSGTAGTCQAVQLTTAMLVPG